MNNSFTNISCLGTFKEDTATEVKESPSTTATEVKESAATEVKAMREYLCNKCPRDSRLFFVFEK
jgi:hypothetical protein